MQIVAELRLAGMQDHEFFHAANEGKCSPRMAARRKSFGVNAGVPDLIFVRRPKWPPPEPEFTMRGLWVAAALELKSEDGTLTKAQKLWLANAAAQGWATAVTYGLEAARAQLRVWGFLPRAA